MLSLVFPVALCVWVPIAYACGLNFNGDPVLNLYSLFLSGVDMLPGDAFGLCSLLC